MTSAHATTLAEHIACHAISGSRDIQWEEGLRFTVLGAGMGVEHVATELFRQCERQVRRLQGWFEQYAQTAAAASDGVVPTSHPQHLLPVCDVEAQRLYVVLLSGFAGEEAAQHLGLTLEADLEAAEPGHWRVGVVLEGMSPRDRCAMYYGQPTAAPASTTIANAASAASSTGNSNNSTGGNTNSSMRHKGPMVVVTHPRTFCVDVLHRRLALDYAVPQVLIVARDVDDSLTSGHWDPEAQSRVHLRRITNALPLVGFAAALCVDAQGRFRRSVEAVHRFVCAENAAKHNGQATTSSSADSVPMPDCPLLPGVRYLTDMPAVAAAMLASPPHRLPAAYALQCLQLQGGDHLSLFPRFRLDVVRLFEHHNVFQHVLQPVNRTEEGSKQRHGAHNTPTMHLIDMPQTFAAPAVEVALLARVFRAIVDELVEDLSQCAKRAVAANAATPAVGADHGPPQPRRGAGGAASNAPARVPRWEGSADDRIRGQHFSVRGVRLDCVTTADLLGGDRNAPSTASADAIAASASRRHQAGDAPRPAIAGSKRPRQQGPCGSNEAADVVATIGDGALLPLLRGVLYSHNRECWGDPSTTTAPSNTTVEIAGRNQHRVVPSAHMLALIASLLDVRHLYATLVAQHDLPASLYLCLVEELLQSYASDEARFHRWRQLKMTGVSTFSAINNNKNHNNSNTNSDDSLDHLPLVTVATGGVPLWTLSRHYKSVHRLAQARVFTFQQACMPRLSTGSTAGPIEIDDDDDKVGVMASGVAPLLMQPVLRQEVPQRHRWVLARLRTWLRKVLRPGRVTSDCSDALPLQTPIPLPTMVLVVNGRSSMRRLVQVLQDGPRLCGQREFARFVRAYAALHRPRRRRGWMADRGLSGSAAVTPQTTRLVHEQGSQSVRESPKSDQKRDETSHTAASETPGTQRELPDWEEGGDDFEGGASGTLFSLSQASVASVDWEGFYGGGAAHDGNMFAAAHARPDLTQRSGRSSAASSSSSVWERASALTAASTAVSVHAFLMHLCDATQEQALLSAGGGPQGTGLEQAQEAQIRDEDFAAHMFPHYKDYATCPAAAAVERQATSKSVVIDALDNTDDDNGCAGTTRQTQHSTARATPQDEAPPSSIGGIPGFDVVLAGISALSCRLAVYRRSVSGEAPLSSVVPPACAEIIVATTTACTVAQLSHWLSPGPGCSTDVIVIDPSVPLMRSLEAAAINATSLSQRRSLQHGNASTTRGKPPSSTGGTVPCTVEVIVPPQWVLAHAHAPPPLPLNNNDSGVFSPKRSGPPIFVVDAENDTEDTSTDVRGAHEPAPSEPEPVALDLFAGQHAADRAAFLRLATAKGTTLMERRMHVSRQAKLAFQQSITAERPATIRQTLKSRLDTALTSSAGGGLFAGPGAVPAVPLSHNTLAPGPMVLMDEREFRSTLPFHVHEAGLRIIPMTLVRGDYILSPTVAIERKSFPDLTQSLYSGRLHAQLTAMCRAFQHPMVLVEDSSFSQGTPAEDRPTGYRLVSATVSATSTAPTTMAVLYRRLLRVVMLHAPVRWLWSRGPAHSARLIAALKGASVAGAGAASAQRGGALTTPDCALAVDNPDANDASYTSAAAEEERDGQRTAMAVLARLPGVTPQALAPLMTAAGSLRGLAHLTEAQLQAAFAQAAAGASPSSPSSSLPSSMAVNAAKQRARLLYQFLHSPLVR